MIEMARFHPCNISQNHDIGVLLFLWVTLNNYEKIYKMRNFDPDIAVCRLKPAVNRDC